MPEGSTRNVTRFKPPRFRPRAPWLGGDLQTVRNTIFNRVGALADLSRWPGERLELPAGDGSGDLLSAMLQRPTMAAGRPLAVLVHGLTGCEDSGYMRATARCLLESGYPVLRLNLRGAGPSRLRCRREYHAGRSEDLRLVLGQLQPELTANGVVAIGFSLGANMLLKYLGEDGQAAPLRAAAAVSAPIDLKAAQRRIMMPRNSVYHRYMLDRMKLECTHGRSGVSEEEREAAMAADSVYAFDDVFVARRNGFGTAEKYYAINSAERFLPAVRTPTLVIHARNDPWIPVDPYLHHDWKRNPFLTPLLPKSGGHVGFHGRGGPPAWHDRCLLQFFESVAG